MKRGQRQVSYTITFSTEDFDRFRREYPNFRYNFSTFEQWTKSCMESLKTCGGFLPVDIDIKRTTRNTLINMRE